MFNNDELKIITTALKQRRSDLNDAIEFENELNELNEFIIELHSVNLLIDKINN